MDDNLDEYQILECRRKYFVHDRKKFDIFTCPYTVEMQSLDEVFIAKSRKLVEEQHCRFGIICANLEIGDKPTAKHCFGALMEERMYEEQSLAAVEVETERVLGVLVVMERRSFMKVEPDLFEDEELDPDVQYMEELRCLLINLAEEPMSKVLEQGESYLEIILLCASRDVTNHFEIEIALIDVLIKKAIADHIKCIIVVSDYKKHQEHFMSLDFKKVSEMGYGLINAQSHQKRFLNTGASDFIMCFSLTLVDKFKGRRETEADVIIPRKFRRPTRLKLNYS